MFIALIGTPSAGKKTVLEYLERKHDFRQIGLQKPSEQMEAARISSSQLEIPMNKILISGNSSPELTPTIELPQQPSSIQSFATPARLLDYITRNWLMNHVTTDLKTYAEIEPFLKRPFFLLVLVDGPLRIRFERERRRTTRNGQETTTSENVLTLEEFIDQHDLLLNGPPTLSSATSFSTSASDAAHHQLLTDYRRVSNLANVSIHNNFSSIQGLYDHLDQVNLVNEERLRPGWDTYFMTLASLASHRSNCMKRRVGALLVRSKRILSTGYNGTPRGLTNCNQGGCSRCNGSARGGEALDECLCLHAEENALLEAGRDRVGDDSVLYCNTCPCLRCSVKIVQTGVREVVYNQSYSMDAASAMVLKEGGVILRRFHMPFLAAEQA